MTIRQLTFVENVARGKSHREAAISAGYSLRSAASIGSSLVKETGIAKLIEELRSTGAFKAPPCVTPDTILQRLTASFQSVNGPLTSELAALSRVMPHPRKR